MKFQLGEAQQVLGMVHTLGRTRGFSFDLVEHFDWNTALTQRDLRIESEERWIALGLVAERMYVVVWTPRGRYTRIISMRKANDREVARYAQAKS